MKKLLFVLIPFLLLSSCKKKLSSELIAEDRGLIESRNTSSVSFSSDLPFSYEFLGKEKNGTFLYTFNCFNFTKKREQTRRRITPDKGNNVFFIGYDAPYTMLSEGESNKEKREVKAIGIHFSSKSKVTSCQALLTSKDEQYLFQCQRSEN